MEQTLNTLFEEHFPALCNRAKLQLSRWSSKENLDPEELVSIVFQRMLHQQLPQFNDEEHFLNLTDKQMRYELSDRERERKTQKRGGDQKQDPLGSLIF